MHGSDARFEAVARLHGTGVSFEAVSWLYYEIWTSDQPDWVRGPLRSRPFIFFVAVTAVTSALQNTHRNSLLLPNCVGHMQRSAGTILGPLGWACCVLSMSHHFAEPLLHPKNEADHVGLPSACNHEGAK